MLQLFFAPNRGSSLRSACAVSGGRTWREAGGRDDGIKGLFLPLPCSHKLTYSNSTSFKAFTALRQRPAGSCNLDTSSVTCSSFFLVRLEWEQKNDYRESKTRRRRERWSDEVVGCPESAGMFLTVRQVIWTMWLSPAAGFRGGRLEPGWGRDPHGPAALINRIINRAVNAFTSCWSQPQVSCKHTPQTPPTTLGHELTKVDQIMLMYALLDISWISIKFPKGTQKTSI